MDREERDKIREQYTGQTGIGHHVERLVNAADNAEDQGDEPRAAAARAQAEDLGYAGRGQGEAERAGAERKQAAKAKGDDRPAGRVSPAAKRQTTAQAKPQEQAGDTDA